MYVLYGCLQTALVLLVTVSKLDIFYEARNRHGGEVKSGEHIGISPLTNKTVQLRKDSAVCHLLLNCNYSPTFEDFSVLCHENKKYLLELKGSFLIMRETINESERTFRHFLSI